MNENLKGAMRWLVLVGVGTLFGCNAVLDVGSNDGGSFAGAGGGGSAGGGGGGAGDGGGAGGGGGSSDAGTCASDSNLVRAHQDMATNDSWTLIRTCYQCTRSAPDGGPRPATTLDAGAQCVNDSQCESYCCGCSNGRSGSYSARACLFGVCADAVHACDFVELDAAPRGAYACETAAPGMASAGSYTFVSPSVSANCQPVVPADPVTFTGSLSITPRSAAGAGPVSVTRGRFIDASGRFLAGFAATGSSAFVPYGSTGTLTFQKTPGSMSPAAQCSTLPCNSMVTVELQLGGANVSLNTKVVSAPMMVNCVQ